MERDGIYVKSLWTEVTNSAFKYKLQVKYTKEYNYDSMSIYEMKRGA